MSQTSTQAAMRRTFAIISHPDAGKTTLTEKLLLYSGAIHLAGSVKARRAGRHAVSDWMKLEQERGISITSSVLQFHYEGSAINLLDTPGHADFSEDTYRTLAAVDSAIMLIDHAKGIESRTRKLFEICRMRHLPIITFINKLDREGRDPFELLDELRDTLQLQVVPCNWPIGMGRDFKGVVDRQSQTMLLYQAADHGSSKLESQSAPLSQATEILGERQAADLHESLALLEAAGDADEPGLFEQGKLSYVFFGSAMSNFAIEPLLRFVAQRAAKPAARATLEGELIPPEQDQFSGFVFKIQANMNPKHRDRMAFLRVVSGHFQRGMTVQLGRTGQAIKLAKPHSFLAQERSLVEEAWPGDIVGLYDPGHLRIGDTLAEGRAILFAGIPRFAPEFFARLVLNDPLRRKALDEGLQQLAHEGVIQLFFQPKRPKHDPILGAVGILQFDVLVERMRIEYRVQATLSMLPYKVARWIGGSQEGFAWLEQRQDYPILLDRNQHPVVLAESMWPLQYAMKNAPNLELFDVEPL